MFYLNVLNLIVGIPQLNFYYTDLLSKSNNTYEHNCLRIVTYTREKDIYDDRWNIYNREINVTNYEIISYCMNEFSPKFDVDEKSNLYRKLTFSELSKENISSEQLYLWSAPIDLIENYQYQIIHYYQQNYFIIIHGQDLV